MKRVLFVSLVLGLALTACSGGGQPTATPVPTAAATATTMDETTGTPTSAEEATASGEPTTTPAEEEPTAAAGEPMEAPFVSSSRTGDEIHLECDPSAITFTVEVNDPNVAGVDFFFRMKDKPSSIASQWSNGENMNALGEGKFEFVMDASNIPSNARFDEAWFQYQFVAANKIEQVVARSPIFAEEISFTPACQ